MKFKSLHILLTPLFLFLSYEVFSQVQITGPVCVKPGVEYQYNITGQLSDTTDIELCVIGGTFANSQSSCYQGPPISMVRVTWFADASGRIEITSQELDSPNLSVNISSSLNGGEITSSSVTQEVNTQNVPAAISCTPATGGDCSYNYVYQWEQSSDNLTWNSIAGATSSTLVFSNPLSSTMYFRRKTTITEIDDESYSNVATIIVSPSN